MLNRDNQESGTEILLVFYKARKTNYMPDITSSVLIVNSRLFDGFPVPAIQTILHIKTRYKGFYVQASNNKTHIVMSHSED